MPLFSAAPIERLNTNINSLNPHTYRSIWGNIDRRCLPPENQPDYPPGRRCGEIPRCAEYPVGNGQQQVETTASLSSAVLLRQFVCFAGDYDRSPQICKANFQVNGANRTGTTLITDIFSCLRNTAMAGHIFPANAVIGVVIAVEQSHSIIHRLVCHQVSVHQPRDCQLCPSPISLSHSGEHAQVVVDNVLPAKAIALAVRAELILLFLFDIRAERQITAVGDLLQITRSGQPHASNRLIVRR